MTELDPQKPIKYSANLPAAAGAFVVGVLFWLWFGNWKFAVTGALVVVVFLFIEVWVQTHRR